MTHGIAEADWVAYLDGRLPPGERDRLESHLIGCLTCWERYRRLAETTAALGEAADELQGHFPLADGQLYAALHRVRARIRAEGDEAAPAQALTSSISGLKQRSPVSGQRAAWPSFKSGADASPVRERLDRLESVMAPMCGSRTALRALQAAALGSPARSLEKVTRDNWTPFLTSLTSIAAVMCGETGAHLVWESGQF
jgi:anti-sigma factor RsiW